MPYPSQIDRDTIVKTARQMIEDEGVDNLSLRSLADALGVKAPSLYRYVKNKTALLRAVNEMVLHERMQELYVAADEALVPKERMLAVAKAYRRFVHENPACYMLSVNTPADETRPDADESEQFALPIQGLIAEISGHEKSLAAVRGAYAFIHGWVVLEVMQQFERGGDLEADFEDSFRAYLEGW